MEYDRYASAVRAEYGAFANAIAADYLLRQASHQDTATAVAQFRLSALALVSHLISRATSLSDDYFVGLGIGPQQHYGLVDALSVIATKNVNDLIKKLIGASQRLASVLRDETGAIGKLLQQRAIKPDLVAIDTSGRRWVADKLITVMARDFAYQAYLDAQIHKLDDDGTEFVQIVYPDTDHENHGLVMRLEELSQARKKIFHPNSTARIKAYVPS